MLERSGLIKAIQKLFNKNVHPIKIVVFRPHDVFYDTDFDERLKILVKKIKTTYLYLKKNFPKEKLLFVAPEYLFKDYPKKGEDRFYSQKQKKKFKLMLGTLSLDCENLIIIPGTFSWVNKTHQLPSYHNTLYTFFNGFVEKYNKTNPFLRSDFDFLDSNPPKDYDDARCKLFKDGRNDTAIKKINDLTLGLEICLDSVEGHLVALTKDKKIDMQIVLADGAEDPQFVHQKGVLFVKVERTFNSQNLLGTIEKADSSTTSVKSAEDLGPLDTEPELRCYQFYKA